jgi:hypothetical protein
LAITIRNKKTEELIRKIGRRTGEGPSAVIARLAEQENARSSRPSEAEIARRLALFEELAQRYPPPDPKPSWEEIEREAHALYDYVEAEPASDRKGRRG